MKRIDTLLSALLVAGTTLLASGTATASEGASGPYAFKPEYGNTAALQRGARNFMNYCSGCHSMGHLRYSQLAKDLDIPEDLMKANLMFTSGKIGDHIVSAMPSESEKWLGKQPPDLTVETRMRGADWVYNYLMTFYVDPSRPMGTNNLMLPGASMPNVLGALQGVQIMEEGGAEGEAPAGHGGEHAGPAFKVIQAGSLDEKDFEKFVADTTSFMAYAAEPGRAARISMGIKVMLFLVVFTVLAYMLKREFWKDVH